MVVEDEENAFRLLIASPKWTYCWIQENWMKLCWCWDDKVIFGMLVVLRITLLYYILMGWQGTSSPPLSSLSSPLLYSHPTPKTRFFFLFPPHPKLSFELILYSICGFLFSLPIQQGHPTHTITPSLHPPKLQKRHLLTGSGFGAWLFAPKIPLSPNFFLLLGLGKAAAWGKKNLQLLICISFMIWRSAVVCLRDWIGLEQKKTTDHTTTAATTIWMDCAFDRSCNQQLRIAKLD